MNYIEFNKYWNTNYPESNPIGYKLRSIYQNRWLRIHSLPESKRYAESEEDYQIILERQNELFLKLMGENADIIILIGQYEIEQKDGFLKEFSDFGQFVKCKTVELHKIYPEEYDPDDFYNIYIKPDNWRKNSQNEMLKKIVDDEFRAIFICPKRNCILAPYDGGMDIIVDNQEKRNNLKAKYKDWLSEREDGM
ncbi:DUF3885 domain-containing protein [Aquimarina sp. 2304DJ70-9]|uniref:DUF3885 domain-containing protein n=1 Tax=Aquimarina penaris TaxID=3231044 RepID=UPI003461DE52